MFRLFLSLVVLIGLSNEALACSFLTQQKLPEETEALFELEQKDLVKTKIDAVVWGVFTDHQPLPEAVRFHVGEVIKGPIENQIDIKTDQADLILGTEVYYLNLRKVDDKYWTDIDVPQDHLDWERESCEIDSSTARCAKYMLKLEKIKGLCLSAIKEQYSGCVYPTELPKICRQFRKLALE